MEGDDRRDQARWRVWWLVVEAESQPAFRDSLEIWFDWFHFLTHLVSFCRRWRLHAGSSILRSISIFFPLAVAAPRTWNDRAAAFESKAVAFDYVSVGISLKRKARPYFRRIWLGCLMNNGAVNEWVKEKKLDKCALGGVLIGGVHYQWIEYVVHRSYWILGD
jgi:hypothetical protein